MMSEKLRPLDYASRPVEPPRRDYSGCLVPLAITVACIGLMIFAGTWKPTQMSPGERSGELQRLFWFLAMAVGLIVLRLILFKKTKWEK